MSTLLLACLASWGRAQQQFYVSPDGNDRWSGTRALPNATNTDGPFATLERARDALRALRSTQREVSGVTVQIRGGTYHMLSTFTLGAADSGTASHPSLWRAYRNETVRLLGGKAIQRFLPVRDSLILRRLSPGARTHVVVADLSSEGIGPYGDITQRGGPPMELFYQGRRMPIARYPNEGYLRIAGVPQYGDSMMNKGLDREKRFDGVPAGRHYGRISYEGSRPNSWHDTEGIVLHGYWTFDWSDSYQHVQAIDTIRKEITIRPPHHWYGYTKNQRYYYLNILEELDAPGEWYLDRARGLLYWWPPSRVTKGEAIVSLLDRPLIAIDSSSWVRLEGITFLDARGRGVQISGGHDITVARCSFSNLGLEAVTIDGGFHNGVESSLIHDVALGGILLRGGDRATLQAAHHFAVNNHIHHYSTWLRTGQYAVVLSGVGHRLAHTLIHDSPFEGVHIQGNDHLIEYNEFHHLMKETGDAGAIHTGRDWTWRGNIIRYNYFHDLKGPGLHGVMAVYLDDWASGFTVVGNLFYRAGRATLIGGGRDNTVEHNIYVECSPSIHLDARGTSWASYYFDSTGGELLAKMKAMHYQDPPYSIRYPELLHLYDDAPALPKYNRIVGNISYGGRWMDIYDYQQFDLSIMTIKDNLIGDPIVLRRRKDTEKGWDPYYLNIDLQEGYLAIPWGDKEVEKVFSGNRFVKGNPGVLAPEKGDFRLKPQSTASTLGFSPIGPGKAGLRR